MPVLLVDEPREGVTRIALHRPETLNAMNAELVASCTTPSRPWRPTAPAGS